jgi:hypothetical protein
VDIFYEQRGFVKESALKKLSDALSKLEGDYYAVYTRLKRQYWQIAVFLENNRDLSPVNSQKLVDLILLDYHSK